MYTLQTSKQTLQNHLSLSLLATSGLVAACNIETKDADMIHTIIRLNDSDSCRS